MPTCLSTFTWLTPKFSWVVVNHVQPSIGKKWNKNRCFHFFLNTTYSVQIYNIQKEEKFLATDLLSSFGHWLCKLVYGTIREHGSIIVFFASGIILGPLAPAHFTTYKNIIFSLSFFIFCFQHFFFWTRAITSQKTLSLINRFQIHTLHLELLFDLTVSLRTTSISSFRTRSNHSLAWFLTPQWTR